MGTFRQRQGFVRRYAAALSALLVLVLGGANGIALAACAPKDFDSAKFTVCTFDPRHDDIRLFLSGPDDKPYGSLGALASALRQKGEKLAFAMNAGACVHLETLYGENSHHIAESGFKALARALREAVELDPKTGGHAPSTKGVL